ncbi:MAG: hypothetical protein IJQ16_06790 [Selenomonadaceae bacterium]|nr:hypothetical protein [Selenomonadaceae bacterium]
MKKFFMIFVILFGICNASYAAKISATFFVNGEIYDQFERDSEIVTLKQFSETVCRLQIKNKLDTKFRPRIKIRFGDNWSGGTAEIKNLSDIESGGILNFDIEMKNFSVRKRKNTSAWLQIWMDGHKIISENDGEIFFEKINYDDRTIFDEHYFCVKFDFEISDDEVEN